MQSNFKCAQVVAPRHLLLCLNLYRNIITSPRLDGPSNSFNNVHISVLNINMSFASADWLSHGNFRLKCPPIYLTHDTSSLVEVHV